MQSFCCRPKYAARLILVYVVLQELWFHTAKALKFKTSIWYHWYKLALHVLILFPPATEKQHSALIRVLGPSSKGDPQEQIALDNPEGDLDKVQYL